MLHEKEYFAAQALIDRPGGAIPELMDEPRIQCAAALDVEGVFRAFLERFRVFRRRPSGIL